MAVKKDEAALWNDVERSPRYWSSGKSKLYNNMDDRSLLVLKNDIFTNIRIQMHRESSRRINIQLSTGLHLG